MLKDGIKYIPYKYKNEEELEKMVIEHYKEIYGEELSLRECKDYIDAFKIKPI